jgi:hypothetical protein
MARLFGPAPFARLGFIAALLVVIALAARAPAARAREGDIVQLASGSAVHLATPPFLQVGKRYAFTWPGGGPPQTYAIKALRTDGWILVEVADETTHPELYIPGEFPTRWLHVGLAVSIQEMRPIIP